MPVDITTNMVANVVADMVADIADIACFTVHKLYSRIDCFVQVAVILVVYVFQLAVIQGSLFADVKSFVLPQPGKSLSAISLSR